MEVSMLPRLGSCTLLMLLSLLPGFLRPECHRRSSQNSRRASPSTGAKIFQSHCATCHGADGRGHGPASVALKATASRLDPDLAKKWRKVSLPARQGNHRRKTTCPARPRQSRDAYLGTNLPPSRSRPGLGRSPPRRPHQILGVPPAEIAAARWPGTFFTAPPAAPTLPYISQTSSLPFLLPNG